MTSASATGPATTRSAMAVPSSRPRITKRDGFLTPALGVSIVIAIFAVVTQFLAATGAISLSTTQQLAMWLAAAGLIVLLWIAYMAVEAQARLAKAVEAQGRLAEALVAATAAAEREALAMREATQATVAQAKQAAEEREAATRQGRDDTVASAEPRAAGAGSRDAWVPPVSLRRLTGSEQPVNTADVFPYGCILHSITDHYEEADTRGDVVDNSPRRRVYRCVVVDLHPALEDQPHDAVVNILTDQKPSLPAEVPHPFVVFDGLTITPCVTDRSSIRMGYTLRATGIKQAIARPAPGNGQIPPKARPVDPSELSRLSEPGYANLAPPLTIATAPRRCSSPYLARALEVERPEIAGGRTSLYLSRRPAMQNYLPR
jgi:hypothetical protein